MTVDLIGAYIELLSPLDTDRLTELIFNCCLEVQIFRIVPFVLSFATHAGRSRYIVANVILQDIVPTPVPTVINPDVSVPFTVPDVPQEFIVGALPNPFGWNKLT